MLQSLTSLRADSTASISSADRMAVESSIVGIRSTIRTWSTRALSHVHNFLLASSDAIIQFLQTTVRYNEGALWMTNAIQRLTH
mmetsp:Transcript_22422/g.33152  ORF Transcript_22422/g.33152 Transcript_22422/m.33152 type:complete len:84 (+) Transcript_22422:481-732(+)